MAFVDFQNDQDHQALKPKSLYYHTKARYEVLIPYETSKEDMLSIQLDRTEIQARIYNVLRELDLKPLEEIDFDADYEKDLGFDSLEWTAIVTSIEHEFHTVFEDTLFEHYRTINDFVKEIESDFTSF